MRRRRFARRLGYGSSTAGVLLEPNQDRRSDGDATEAVSIDRSKGRRELVRIHRTIRTEHGAWLAIFCDTLPRRRPDSRPRPRLPTTIRSTLCSCALARISTAGSPLALSTDTAAAPLAL